MIRVAVPGVTGRRGTAPGADLFEHLAAPAARSLLTTA